MRSMVILTGLLAMLTGCEAPSSQAKPGRTTGQGGTSSAVLKQAFIDVLGDALMSRKLAGQPLPPDVMEPGFYESVYEATATQLPAAFDVTESQEAQLSAGETNDEANRYAVQEALEQIDAQSVPLPIVSQYLAERFKTEGLSGVRLELARRLLSEQLQSALVGRLQGAI